MPVLRKRAPVDTKGVNGLYVHSNPPRILSVSAAHIKQLIRNGDIERLEQVVLEGQGKKLVGEYSADFKTRSFLKSVPSLISKISLLHDSVNSDRLAELQSILEEEPERKKRLVMAKDESGVGLIHKAVYYDLKSIYRWLIDKFPQTVSIRDSEGRTPYFYSLMCKDPAAVQKLLVLAGADPQALDYRQHSTKYYANHMQELELPCGPKSLATSRKSTANKESLNFKKSNIRIWIHQRNMANLQQVVWEGHGPKLLVEHSNNPKMKKFLEAVPFIMGLIKDVHCDVQNDDLETLKHRIAPPVPIAVLTAKDSNGLTPLHKAVGLGKEEIVDYIIKEVPNSINAIDNEGRTPLHYSALLKDDNKMFNYLIEHGADESALDNRQKTAAYYKTRVSELDSKLLNVIPDCPRGAKEPNSFDWNMLTSPALPVNGVIKRAALKMENGLGEKLEESSNPKENSEQIEEPKEDEIKSENKSENELEKDLESPAENGNEKHDEDNKNEAGDESQEKSIEGEPVDDPEVLADDPEQNEPVLENAPDEGEEEEQNETEKEEEAENENKEENEDDVSNEENHNTAEDDEKDDEGPTEGEPNNEEENSSNEMKDDENNNEPDTKDPEKETPANGAENTEGSRTRPTSRNIRTPSANTSRPASQDSTHSKPSTAVKKTEQQKDIQTESEDESEKVDADPETEGEGVIEGVVNGENEVEPMNNEGQNHRVMEDPDIKAMIDSGNMEQLASLVLNGDGEKLIGHKTDNQELQTFLDNVPIYIAKIKRIHVAARDGSLRDLQAALDRRKFAVARDNTSPNGASPLHVAVVFGRTSVVRYLAGRFPETIHAEDDNGRTPLHYAAVLHDNGHYYNLLMHLGADNRIEDKFGQTPANYIKDQSEFNHRQILVDFGAEDDEAEEILNDKVTDDFESARKNFDDEDMISVLDRCFNVLHGRRNSNAISATSTNTVTSGPNNTSSYSSIISKHMKRYIFDSVKLRLTKLDHNLYDVIWPSVKKLPTEPSIRHALEEDFPLGIIAPDFYIYKVYEKFLEPIIKDYNYIDLYHEMGPHPLSNFLPEGEELELDLDQHAKWIITGTIECTRNIMDFELPKSLATSELEMVERLVTNVLLNGQTAQALYPNASEYEIKEKGSGTYYTMNEVLEDLSEAKVILASNSLLIPLWNIPESDRLHGKYWPYGRGVFISNSCNLAVYVNVLDHIRIVTCTAHESPGTIGLIYSRIARLIAIFKEELEFKFDEKLGHLSSRPTVLGCGLRFNLTLKCPNLLKEPDNLRNLCTVRGLTYQRNTNAADVFKVGNYVIVGVTELTCFRDFTTAVANILQLEKDMAMSNSLHIAAMFVNIFKKKKNSSFNCE